MKRKISLHDLADYLVQHESVSPAEAQAFAEAYFAVVEEGLVDDKFVKIKGLGTFKLVTVSERESVDVNTGERIQIDSYTKVSFTPDNAMKELVNRPFAHFVTVDLNDDVQLSELEDADELQPVGEEDDAEPEESTDGATIVDDASAVSSQASADGTAIRASNNEAEPSAQSPKQTSSAPEAASQAAATDEQEEQPTSDVVAEPVDKERLEVESDEMPEDEDDGVGEKDDSEPSAVTPSAAETNVEVAPESPMQPTSDDQPSAGDVKEEDKAEPATGSQVDEHLAEADLSKPESTGEGCKADDGLPSSQPQISYVYTPTLRRRNYWKMVAMILGVLILMTLSYFAGYFRVFCPCSLPFVGQYIPVAIEGSGVTQPVPAASVPAGAVSQVASVPATAVATHTPQAAQSDSQPASAPQTAAGASPSPGAEKTHAAKPVADQPQPQATKPATQTARAQTVQQSAKPVKPTQSSRPRYHVVKTGDNLYKISRRYYDTDAKVRDIIRANGLKKANTITKGMRLRLP